MIDDPKSSISDTPIPLRLGAIAMSALIAISTLPWIWMSIGTFGGFAWGLFGFELIVLLGCLMTIGVSTGRIWVGGAFPLALICLAGTLLVASVFGIYVDAKNVVGSNHPQITPWVGRTFRLYITAVAFFSLIASLDIYRRNTRSWGLALRSVLFLVPVIATLSYFKVNGAPSIEDSAGELSAIRMVLVILGGLLLGILLSVGGHLLIRSFETALPEAESAENAAPGDA